MTKDSELFLGRMNEGFQRPTHTFYEKLHPSIRPVVRTGEFIVAAAINRGIELALPSFDGADEWLAFMPKNLLRAFDKHSRVVVEEIIKDAQRIAKRSILNGDREGVTATFDRIMIDFKRQAQPAFNGWT